MKYIKKFETLPYSDAIYNSTVLKTLVSYLISTFNKLGYIEQNFVDRGTYETEFYYRTVSNETYVMNTKLKDVYFSTIPTIQFGISIMTVDPFFKSFIEHLKTIKELKLIQEDDDNKLFPELTVIIFTLKDKDGNEVIKEIDKYLQPHIQSNKFNI